MSEQFDRRTYILSDADRRQQDDIERLISDEEDPKVRLHLMVLNKINLALIANTNVTNTIRQDLDKHLESFSQRVKEQDEMINKGIGAWRVIVIVLAVAQVLFGTLWATVRDDFNSLRGDVNRLMVDYAKQSSKLEEVEKSVVYLIRKNH